MMDKPEARPSTGYLTEERLMIRDMAREFTRNEVLPVANKLDPEKGEIPQDLIDKMGELGFFGILIPERFGGLGLGYFEYCLVAEELARGWMSVASLIARGNLFYHSIPGATEEERVEKTRLMARGKYLGAFSMSEPNVGSDVASVACRAVRDGDEWDEALRTAVEEATSPTVDYLAGSPHLADHLENGLDALNIAARDEEDELYRS